MKLRIVGLLLSFILMSCVSVKSQEWRKIVPLESTCEDVKNLRVIETCTIPVSRQRFPEIWFTINLADGNDEWKVPNGTVTRVSIMFIKSLSLKDFEVELEYFKTRVENFEVLPDDDLIDSKIYQNDRKGISFVVRTLDTDDDGEDEKYVTGVTLFPPKVSAQDNKHSGQ